jgi:hypothetical protein
MMARYLLSRAYNRLLRPHEVWNIGIVKEPIDVFLEPKVRPKVHWLSGTRTDEFLADPFAVVRDKEIHIFCEELDRQANKGRIVHIRVDEDASCCERRVVIESRFHMSYPYLFEHEGEIYCVPETHQAREISLYQAKRFPYDWYKADTLVSGIAGLDATVLEFGEYWWLMFSDMDVNPLAGLFIWYARDLKGPWMPHRANPVKKSIHSSRPAGTPFARNSCLYRPSQDCSKTYGWRVVLNRVTRLTPTEFEEQPVATIEPYADSEYPHAIHTISAAGRFTLVDGKRLTRLTRTPSRAT